MNLTRALELYETLVLIRAVEETICAEYERRNIRGPVHLSLGQEAVAVGALAPSRKSDLCVSTHRDHAHYLAKGGDMRAMVDELYGLGTGSSRGYGGSMHLFASDVGFMGSSAVLPGSIEIATGLALACKFEGAKNICITFTGDGASDERRGDDEDGSSGPGDDELRKHDPPARDGLREDIHGSAVFELGAKGGGPKNQRDER